ncbi:MAG TPA: D-alanine--D-alanine ligase [Alloiococcus sp.]|nr:D-alanine--D-alanine ligase [Alloiococcus sp.]
MNIFLIYGGKSAEHEVSIVSAYNIVKEINFEQHIVKPIYITREGKWVKGDDLKTAEHINSQIDMIVSEDQPAFDFNELRQEDAVAFPVLHGPNGEDGTVQGLFEVLDVPYVGCGVLASSTGMDKIISKALFEHAGIPQLPYVPVNQKRWKLDQDEVIQSIESELSYPMYVKPANMGSSVGISEAKDQNELRQAIVLAFEFDHRVVVEQGVIAREIEISILGNEDVNTSVPGELVKDIQFYDYESKYENNNVTLQIPANVDNNIITKLKDYAAKAFLAIDGSGLTRADFFVTENNEIYINEVNTFPGFTPISMYPKLWENTGLSYHDLIEELIQLGIKRHQVRSEKQLKDR